MKQTFAKCMIILTVILMDVLGGAEVDLFVPSFPELKSQFSLSPFWVEALLSINFIGFCLSLFFVGGLADRYGRKPIILLGLIIFIIGSMLCLWAPSFEFLLVGRFLQGIGVAAPSTLSFLIIADSYPMKQQQFLLAMLNGAMNISVALAPVVGSYITMYFHWQGNFIALLLLASAVLIMTMIFLPKYKLPEHKESIALSGYIPIFKSKTLMLLVTNIVFMFVPYWIFIGMSPIFYMEDLGVSLTHFGYYQGALAMVFALGSIAAGFMISKYDAQKMLIISSRICIFGLLVIAVITFSQSTNPLLYTLAFLPFDIATIIPTTLLAPLCLSYMPKAKGRISAIMQGMRLILMALGLQIASYFYLSSFHSIGMVIASFIIVVAITMFMILKNKKIMHLAKEK